MPRIIELFCGASGFGLGAELAGFELVASVDNDPLTTFSHKVNFPNCELVLADLSDMSADELLLALGISRGSIDGIIGGPPCQGFSRSGLRNPNDPRNNLLKRFFLIVASVRPAFFVMENVPGLLDQGNSEIVAAAFAEIPSDYTVLGPLKLNANEFGAATNRERVVLFGYDPRRVSEFNLQDVLAARRPAASVRDAISDLPSPREAVSDKSGNFWGRYVKDDTEVSDYAHSLRLASVHHRKMEVISARFGYDWVSGFNPTIHQDRVRSRFSALKQGKRDAPSRAMKLAWAGQCPTLRAGTGPDRGSYQALRPLHPVEPRVITIREAARLQGFPDWFQFHPTIWHSFRMIGNSVSPIFAQKLLRIIYERLNTIENIDKAKTA